jgi:penicillin amidase
MALLAGWDGAMRRDRPEPLIAVAWVRAAFRAVFADELGDELEYWMGPNQNVIRRVLDADPSWCDDVTTQGTVESCDDRFLAALDAALDEITAAQGDDMGKWRWGTPHVARFSHPIFGRIPFLRDLTDITIPNDGGDLTVNRAGTRLLDPRSPYQQIHGPGVRAVYDLANLDGSRFSMAVGQSESPFSPHRRDLLEPWRDGVYRALARPDKPAHTLTLQPRQP